VHRRGRHHQRVDAAERGHGDRPQLVDLAAIAHQPMRWDVPRRADDSPHGRIERRVRVRVDEFAHRGISFADERAVVKQLRRGQERPHVDGHDARSGLDQDIDRRVERRAPVAVELR
jgi:hypothetical protein